MADDNVDSLDIRKEVTYMGSNPPETSTGSQPFDPNALQGVFHDPEGSDWDEPPKPEYPYADPYRVSDPTNPEYDPTNPSYRPELDERSPFLRDIQYLGRDQDGTSGPSPDQSSGESDDTPPPSPVRLSGSLEMDVYKDPQTSGGASDEDNSLGAGNQPSSGVLPIGSGDESGDAGSGGDGILLKGAVEQDAYRQPPQDLSGELDPMPPRDLGGEIDPLPSPRLVAKTPIWDPAGGPPPDDLSEGAYIMGSSSATTDVHAQLWQGGDEHPWPDIPGGGDDEFSAPGGLPVAPPASDSSADLQSWADNTGAAINHALQDTIQGSDEEHPWADDRNAQGSDEFSLPADPVEYVSSPESSGYDPTSPLYNPSYDWSRSDGNGQGGSGEGSSGGDDGSPTPQYQQYQTIAVETDSVENDNVDTLAILTPMVTNTYMYTIDDSALNPTPAPDGFPSYEPFAPPPADSGQPSGQPSDPSADPSGGPSSDPSNDPSSDPSYDPSSDQPDSGGDPAPAPSIPDVPPPAPEAPADGGGDGGGDGGATGGEGLGTMAAFSSDDTWTHFGTVDPAFDPSHDATHDSAMTAFDHEHGAF